MSLERISKDELTLEKVLAAVAALNEESLQAEEARQCFVENLFLSEDEFETEENEIVETLLRELYDDSNAPKYISDALGGVTYTDDVYRHTSWSLSKIVYYYGNLKKYYHELKHELRYWHSYQPYLDFLEEEKDPDMAYQSFAWYMAEEAEVSFQEYCKAWEMLQPSIVRLTNYRENLMKIKGWVLDELGIKLQKVEDIPGRGNRCIIYFSYDGTDYALTFHADGTDKSVPCTKAIIDLLVGETEAVSIREAIQTIYCFLDLPYSMWLEDEDVMTDRAILQAAFLAEPNSFFEREKMMCMDGLYYEAYPWIEEALQSSWDGYFD